MRLLAQTHAGRAGVRLVAPLELDDGRVALVDRGWTPDDGAPLERPEGVVTLEGLLRGPPAGNPFRPANRPEDNVWYWLDAAAMARAAGLPPRASLRPGCRTGGDRPLSNSGRRGAGTAQRPLAIRDHLVRSRRGATGGDGRVSQTRPARRGMIAFRRLAALAGSADFRSDRPRRAGAPQRLRPCLPRLAALLRPVVPHAGASRGAARSRLRLLAGDGRMGAPLQRRGAGGPGGAGNDGDSVASARRGAGRGAHLRRRRAGLAGPGGPGRSYGARPQQPLVGGHASHGRAAVAGAGPPRAALRALRAASARGRRGGGPRRRGGWRRAER